MSWFRSQNADAFPIRPHHLANLMDLHDLKPGKIARNSRQSVARYPVPQDPDPSILSDNRSMQLSFPDAMGLYRVDLLGENDRHARVFERGLRTMLTRFVQLKPDAHVYLARNLLDNICQSCAFGHHCHNTDPEAYKDDKVLGLFEYVAEGLSDPNMSVTRDHNNEIVRIDTDASTTRRVLTEIRSHTDDLEKAADYLRYDPFNPYT